MGASRTNSNHTTNYLHITSLSGLSSDRRVLMMCWGKHASGSTDNTILSLGEATSDTGARFSLYMSSSTSPRGRWNGSTGGTAPSGAADDTWHRWAIQAGPWDNTSRPRKFWFNGTDYSTADGAMNNPGVTLAVLRLFVEQGVPNWSSWNGHVAEVGIWDNPSDSEVTSLISQQETLHVGAMSPAPIRAWRLLSDATATVGGQDLTTVGSVTFNASDHPAVGEGAPARRRAIVVM